MFVATNVNAARLGPVGESPLLPFHDSEDIYVTKFSDTGLYQWHGYYGSADFDAIADIALTSTGTLAITGYAESSWLGANGAQPTTPFNTASFQEGVTLGLNASDGNYLWHTFLEGTIKALAIKNDALYISGQDATHYTTEPERYTPAPLRGIDGLFVLRYRP